ncbi:MAG TPA: hypothetical protein VLA44_12685 [Clostridia bacterium]|nr:hypothetical protein [Clostridia bacterium]
MKGRRAGGFAAGTRATVLFLLVSFASGGCVPARATATPEPSQSAPAPAGWLEHELAGSGATVALPEAWIVLGEDELADPARLRELARDFAGAGAVFGRLEAQGRRARIILLGIDPRARGTGTFPPTVTVVAVEPALPPLLLGIGADFAVAALQNAFEIETGIDQADVETPLGGGIRIGFAHRVVGPDGGPGFRAEHDGAIVTTGSASFLVSLNTDPETAPTDTPALDEVLATLRAGE